MKSLAELAGADLRVPLVQGGQARYANLDYAASAPALAVVAAQVGELLPVYASVHRGAGYASQVCTAAYESARRDVAAFAGARDDDVVIFTRNTTDALNLLATAVPGPVVHLDIEHHANLLPWQTREARLVRAGRTVADTVAAVAAELAREPAALLAVTGASNVTGECLPIAAIASLAHRHGARVVLDGAQLVPHQRVSLTAADVDYLAFSGHKMYAPFGSGVLIGRRDWLDAAPAYLAGGGAVQTVGLSRTTWAASPARHEGALLALLDDGLAAAVRRRLPIRRVGHRGARRQVLRVSTAGPAGRGRRRGARQPRTRQLLRRRRAARRGAATAPVRRAYLDLYGG